MKIALIQFNAGANKADNLRRAVLMVEEALGHGAGFVLLPEVFNWRGDTRDKAGVVQCAESMKGESIMPFMSLSKKHRAFILLGSILERVTNQNKAYNTSILLNAQGSIDVKYRKIHLFDARLGDKIIRESDCFANGDKRVIGQVNEFKVGLSICYDLRFGDLYRWYAKQGVQILTVPSCFTSKTGEFHWEPLLRARAIENLAYVLAPNQVGMDARGVQTHGHSMVVSPWGEVLACGSGDQEEIIYADVVKAKIDQARAILPGIIG